MADRKHLLHVKSNVAETAEQYGIDNFLVTPKKPVDSTTGKATDDTLLYGEIAVNYGKGVEALTIRNTEDDVVAFVNENDFHEAGEIAAAGLAAEKMEREESFNYLNNKIGTLVAEMVSTTYAEIKGLREESKLKPGQFYRITDYVTTTTQENTQSANHAFDLIVRADSESVLNENAFAIQHEGDTYFANQKLSAWELKYDIDNDTTKYDWADETNGKGVIYYMKDENDNECPYDFKNIQFNVGANQQAGTVANVFYFTFSVATGTDDATVTDHSLNSGYCYRNKIGLNMISEFIDEYDYYNKRSLNTNVFRNNATSECKNNSLENYCNNNLFGPNCSGNSLGDNCSNNIFGYNCDENTFRGDCRDNILGQGCIGNSFGENCLSNSLGNGCSHNTLGNGCSHNTFGNGCYNNTFGNNCNSNTFGNSCSHNSLGNNCDTNTFGEDCDNNSFGDSCSDNSFGEGCSANSFENYCTDHSLGDNCSNNSFGNNCNGNSFGSNCSNNSLGNGCSDNSFGEGCVDNLFGNNCAYNIFGEECYNNSFGNDCVYNTFGTPSAAKSYYKNIIFENGVQYVQLDCTQTTSDSAFCQNVLVGMGVAGTSSSMKTLTVATAGNAFKTTFKTANDVEVTA